MIQHSAYQDDDPEYTITQEDLLRKPQGIPVRIGCRRYIIREFTPLWWAVSVGGVTILLLTIVFTACAASLIVAG